MTTDWQTLFARKFSGNVWWLEKLLFILKNELEPNERSINLGAKHFEKGEFSRYMSTAASFYFGGEFVKLCFL